MSDSDTEIPKDPAGEVSTEVITTEVTTTESTTTEVTEQVTVEVPAHEISLSESISTDVHTDVHAEDEEITTVITTTEVNATEETVQDVDMEDTDVGVEEPEEIAIVDQPEALDQAESVIVVQEEELETEPEIVEEDVCMVEEEAEVEAEPVAASQPEPASILAAEPEPVAAPVPATASEPESVPEPVAIPEPEPTVVLEPEPVITPEPEPTALPAEPIVVSEPEPVAIPEPEPVAAPEPEPVAAPEPEPVAAPEPEPVAAPEPEPLAVPEPEPVAAPEPEPVAAPEPESVAAPEPEPVAAPEPEPVAIPEPEPVAIPEPEPVAIPEPEPIALVPAPVVSKPKEVLKRKAESKSKPESQPKKAPKAKIPPPPKKIKAVPVTKPDGTEYILPKAVKVVPQGSLGEDRKQPVATSGEAVARPMVTVFNDQGEASGSVTLPAVFKASIRPDVVNFVHTNIAKNARQAYSVNKEAGHQTSAESWGTGRAVARIPRVRGGGTHRSGQGAFGNMCRSGRMFAPTKTFRKWHRAINQDQRRFAVCSALAASALPALVMARGHKIDKINEVPLVCNDGIESITKTKNAVDLLERLGAYEDVEKCADSKKIRAGKGKLRNRRFTMRRGPLIIYNEDHGIKQAFRNLPGVEVLNVDRLNLLKLAPGGHLGRFCVWSQSAFAKLDSIYGTWRKKSTEKSNYNLPRAKMTVADVAALINSDAIQSVVRPAKPASRRASIKKNPLKNKNVLFRLNPHAKATKRAATLAAQKAARGKAVDAKRGAK